jgi:hypothetical protein
MHVIMSKTLLNYKSNVLVAGCKMGWHSKDATGWNKTAHNTGLANIGLHCPCFGY